MTNYISKLFGMQDKADFEGLIKSGAIVLDVRTIEEYNQGHAKNSIHIPLDLLSENLSKLKHGEVIITVCKSGVRSHEAANMLKKKGYQEVYNGGSWQNIAQWLG